MKLVGPASFSLTDSDLQVLKNHPVGHLNFFIGLGMPDQSELIDNMILYIKLFELGVVEVSVIIGDDYSGQIKSTDDEFSLKVGSLPLCYLCQWFDLHLLGEVVDDDDNEFSLSTGK